MAIVTAFTELVELVAKEITNLATVRGDAAAAAGNSFEVFSMTATAGEATGEATTSLFTAAETFGQTVSEQSLQLPNEIFALFSQFLLCSVS